MAPPESVPPVTTPPETSPIAEQPTARGWAYIEEPFIGEKKHDRVLTKRAARVEKILNQALAQEDIAGIEDTILRRIEHLDNQPNAATPHPLDQQLKPGRNDEQIEAVNELLEELKALPHSLRDELVSIKQSLQPLQQRLRNLGALRIVGLAWQQQHFPTGTIEEWQNLPEPAKSAARAAEIMTLQTTMAQLELRREQHPTDPTIAKAAAGIGRMAHEYASSNSDIPNRAVRSLMASAHRLNGELSPTIPEPTPVPPDTPPPTDAAQPLPDATTLPTTPSPDPISKAVEPTAEPTAEEKVDTIPATPEFTTESIDVFASYQPEHVQEAVITRPEPTSAATTERGPEPAVITGAKLETNPPPAPTTPPRPAPATRGILEQPLRQTQRLLGTPEFSRVTQELENALRQHLAPQFETALAQVKGQQLSEELFDMRITGEISPTLTRLLAQPTNRVERRRQEYLAFLSDDLVYGSHGLQGFDARSRLLGTWPAFFAPVVPYFRRQFNERRHEVAQWLVRTGADNNDATMQHLGYHIALHNAQEMQVKHDSWRSTAVRALLSPFKKLRAYSHNRATRAEATRKNQEAAAAQATAAREAAAHAAQQAAEQKAAQEKVAQDAKIAQEKAAKEAVEAQTKAAAEAEAAQTEAKLELERLKNKGLKRQIKLAQLTRNRPTTQRGGQRRSTKNSPPNSARAA